MKTRKRIVGEQQEHSLKRRPAEETLWRHRLISGGSTVAFLFHDQLVVIALMSPGSRAAVEEQGHVRHLGKSLRTLCFPSADLLGFCGGAREHTFPHPEHPS